MLYKQIIIILLKINIVELINIILPVDAKMRIIAMVNFMLAAIQCVTKLFHQITIITTVNRLKLGTWLLFITKIYGSKYNYIRLIIGSAKLADQSLQTNVL